MFSNKGGLINIKNKHDMHSSYVELIHNYGVIKLLV